MIPRSVWLTGGILAVLAVAFWMVGRTAYERGQATTEDAALRVSIRALEDKIASQAVRNDTLARRLTVDSIRAGVAARAAQRSARAADSLRQVIAVTSATTITVRDTVYTVPPEVPERFRADSTAIADGQAALVASQAETVAAKAVGAGLGISLRLALARGDSLDRRVEVTAVANYARGVRAGRLQAVAGVGTVLAILIFAR